MITLDSKEIRGLNWKILVAFASIIAGGAYVYHDLKENTLINREVANELKAELKEQRRLFELRLREAEANQRLTDIRLTVIETQQKMMTK